MQQLASLHEVRAHCDVGSSSYAAPFTKVLGRSVSGAMEVASAGTSKAVEAEGRRERLLASSCSSKAGDSQAAGASAADEASQSF